MEQHELTTRDDLASRLQHWVSHGLITQEEADSIRAWESAQPATDGEAAPRPDARQPRLPQSLVTEALGYLGAALVAAAVALVLFQYWSEMSTALRVGLAALAAALLLVGGAVVPNRLGAAGSRLRAVLWLAGTGIVAGMLGLVAGEVLEWRTGEDVAMFVAGGAALLAIGLWARHRHVLQQVAVFVPLGITAGAAAGRLAGGEGTPPGLAIWGLGLAWLALAWGAVISQRRTAIVLGGLATLLGAQITMGADWGFVLATATAAALVVAAVVISDLVLLAVGAIGALLFLPETVAHYFPGEFAAAIALLVAGAVLVGVALRARRRDRAHRWSGGRYAEGRRSTALVAAGAIAVAATAATVLVGLS
ncbi:MAG: DUF2157 domain-containing protein [Actinomycetota bacterium]